ESIESYYHRFLKLMNDLKRNKNFPEKIASNLKFLNNLQPEWSPNVSIVHQTKDLHTADYTQLYDFLKYNQKEVDELKAERLAKIQDPLALMNDGNQNQIGNGNLVAVRAEETAGIQLQAEEYDLMAAASDLDEIEEVNANCILMANLQQASSTSTQTDSTPVYDTDGSAEVHENCDDNEIFNMFTQEEQYTELLEPIPEPQQVPQNDNNVISEATNVEQGGETVEQHSANFEEIRALCESLYQNLAIEVEKILDLNKQLLKEKSTVSFLLEEKKRLKFDFKTCEDELLDKQIQLEKKIKELNNIV
nr:Gag-Pol polyprotein [Tanacetum cinerariifolium]